MKKILFVLCVVLSVNTFAQDLKFGAKAGLNFATVNGDEVDSSAEYRTSFYIGGFMNISLRDRFSLQPELVYSQQGYVSNSDDTDSTLKLGYLNVPVLLKYDLCASKKFSLFAGPQFGFLTSAKVKSKIEGTSVEVDFKDEIESFELALTLGVAYNVNDNISIDLRYNHGVTSIAKGDTDVYNSVFQLGAAYKF